MTHDNFPDGGLSINSCTNENRPQKKFLYGAMGWPVDILRCLLSEMVKSIEDGGLPRPTTKAVITHSGAYTALSTVKQ
ncbi:hypothetical protein [Acidipropionibacterium virtanenii]|uniref:Uncharacterized protein n=1 Tax=Acidipropionibacterium virtanenii TaxID=2057246 RepID=A0A344UY95_9ACTN|nr:hypothetical protein [Acidipropionibacterium virtanenii]AXE40243.1 hypothetical protein JS278_03109 [Acidipropionibacterium virtanenii]